MRCMREQGNLLVSTYVARPLSAKMSSYSGDGDSICHDIVPLGTFASGVDSGFDSRVNTKPVLHATVTLNVNRFHVSIVFSYDKIKKVCVKLLSL